MFFELKCISPESPTLDDLKYTICFEVACLNFSKMHISSTQMVDSVIFSKLTFYEKDGVDEFKRNLTSLKHNGITRHIVDYIGLNKLKAF